MRLLNDEIELKEYYIKMLKILKHSKVKVETTHAISNINKKFNASNNSYMSCNNFHATVKTIELTPWETIRV